MADEETKKIHGTISKLAGHTRKSLGRILGLEKRVGNNEKKITLLKNIIKATKIDIGKKLAELSGEGNPLDNSVESIKESVLSIKNTLIQQQELDKNQADDDAIATQTKKRNLKEKLREGAGKVGETLKNTGEKVVAPVQDAFSKMFGWLKKLIMAKVVMEMIDWFSDPANTDKVSTIFRFVKDWWPTLVTGLVLFAGALLGPTGIFIGLAALIVGFIPKIIDATKKFLGITKETNKVASEGESTAKAIQDEVNKEQNEDLKPTTTEETIIEENKGGETKEEPPLEMFNKGGQVPGSGDRDTVPAMLTPGEFVMSKGAVEQYGSDTLAGMNAMAGGSNRPSGGHYSGGGEVKHPASFLDKISPLSKKENKEGIISKGFGFLKSAFGGGKKSKSLGGKGGLTLFIDKISNLPIVGPKLADAGKELVVGVEDMITQQHVSLHKISLSAEQKRREGVDAPTKPPVTVAYKNAVDAGQVVAGTSGVGANPGVKIPSFSASAKISPYKVKVLGISR